MITAQFAIVIPQINRQRVLETLAKFCTQYEQTAQTEIAERYITRCGEVGLYTPMVLAQAILETGYFNSWWSGPPRHNFAGIGVTGQSSRERPTQGQWAEKNGIWYRGYSFPSIAAGVENHLALLLIYATPPDKRTKAQTECIAGSVFAPLARTHRYTGKAPLWVDLNGKWAVPGNGYAQRIAAIAARLV